MATTSKEMHVRAEDEWRSMMKRLNGIGMVLTLTLAVATMVTGCATVRRSEARSTEQLLAAAGFVMRPADTTERQQGLAARSPYRLESHTEDGNVVYTYADPEGCQCLYVGGDKEYSQYQRLRVEQRVEHEMEWGAAGPWWWR
jgi:hypothetical protein